VVKSTNGDHRCLYAIYANSHRLYALPCKYAVLAYSVFLAPNPACMLIVAALRAENLGKEECLDGTRLIF
jgi:hypothetical protein